MDPSLALSVQPLPVAPSEKRKPARSKAKATKPSGSPFQIHTPESYKQQLVVREKRHQDQMIQDEANDLLETPKSLKRNLDGIDAESTQTPNKRRYPTNGTSKAGVSEEASGGKELKIVKPARRNVGGRPRIHPVKKAPSKALLFLRKNKPVTQELCADIWMKIFDFSPPGFLLQARQTNSLFRMLLEKQSQWKKARLHTYGFDHPDPPPGLTEMQYADLLTGVGCQAKGCKENKTRKVYWAFQRRWCLPCLTINTVKETDMEDIIKAYPSIRDCIPKACFDGWNRYIWVGDPSQKPDWARNAGSHIHYSCSALRLFIRVVDEVLAVGPDGKVTTKEENDAWVDGRVKANRVLVEKLQQIEAYVQAEKKRKADEAAGIKALRITWFKREALNMDPPLSGDAIELLTDYQKSIDIAREPSDRSWQELLPKLQAHRLEAEEMIQRETKFSKDSDAKKQMCMTYKKISEDRKHNATAGQRFVLELAEKVIISVDALVEAGSVAHVDFVPFVFRRIFEEYDSTHDTGKPGSYQGRPYRLVLDDARMVYECLIAKAMDRWNDVSKVKVAKYLKCPGCRRKDSSRLHEFEPLINHIGDKHTKEVGTLNRFQPELLELPQSPHSPHSRGVREVPWCLLDWPRNLPILASHREVIGEWEPEDDSEYIHAPRVIPSNISRDAFEGRHVTDREDPPRGDFIKNVIYAASLLDATSISAKFKTQIVFRYALDRHHNAPRDFGADSNIPVQVLKDLPTELIRAGIRGLFEGFHCLACRVDDAREKRYNKFADKKQSLGELIKHYLATHEQAFWSSSLFDLPSAEDLWEALMKPGMEEAYQTFGDLFPETEQVLDPDTELCKVASLGPNLEQATLRTMDSQTPEQAMVPAWRDALFTAGSSGQPSVFMS